MRSRLVEHEKFLRLTKTFTKDPPVMQPDGMLELGRPATISNCTLPCPKPKLAKLCHLHRHHRIGGSGALLRDPSASSPLPWDLSSVWTDSTIPVRIGFR